MTKQTERILEALLTDPSADWWGSKIAPIAGLKSGTLYPALMRMERLGWLRGRWEEIDPAEQGRPRRRLYRISAEGEIAAQEILSAAMVQKKLAPSVHLPLPRGAS
jgi:PadR family transcriptional regulator PadR